LQKHVTVDRRLLDEDTHAVLRCPPRRSRAPQAGFGPLRRWITVALVAWLTIVLAGREHVLQAVGLELACIHPGESASPHASTRSSGRHAGHGEHAIAGPAVDAHDAPAVTAPDVDDGEDCPAGCTECACGAAPCAPAAAFQLDERPWHLQEDRLAGSRAGPSRSATALDRPPQRS
jgi:hypothetical protein